MKVACRVLATVGCLMFFPAAAWAQTGAIAGLVADTSGAVLPGVTVEASSPALIEQVRTVITDSQGLYRIVDLRPGTYTITFTLPGFRSLRREGVELTTGFTATVNADLAVGALEETVTVSGAAPLVDTSNVRQQQTLGRETLAALPTTQRTGSFATMLPGAVTASQDVGGLIGERGAQFAIHGQRIGDMNITQDGLDLTIFNSTTYSFNPHNTQEIVLETTGSSAESQTGGVRMTIVPRDGGNVFGGTFAGSFSTPGLQSANLTDDLRARGLFATPSLKQLYDVGGSIGGPIDRDQLWFFTSHRKWASSRYIPGNFHNSVKTPTGTDPVWRVLFYEPDLNRPAFTNDYYQDHSLRLTWQATDRDKIAVSYGVQEDCNCPCDDLSLGTIAPEAAGNHHYQPNWLATANWSRPATTRLLFEAGVSRRMNGIHAKRHEDVQLTDISITELAINRQYGARAAGIGCTGAYANLCNKSQWTQRFSVSYITGSHAFKIGIDAREFSWRNKNANNFDQIQGARSYQFRNRVPVSVTLFATPFGNANDTLTTSVFVQDQWAFNKVTLNMGLRYDAFSGSVDAVDFPAGPFVPARSLPAVKNSPDWTNLSPRAGVAYDLFGTGRTALKASLGRYAIGISGNDNQALNVPIVNQAASATRTWNDTNGNYVPDCVLSPTVPGANGECGAISDLTFGQVRAGNTQYADDVLRGFNSAQFYNWQGSASVQHELWPSTSLNVGYYRTWYGNFRATDNLALTPADFGPYCITAPTDSRLPGGGGNQLCGLYDVNPSKFGQVSNLIALKSEYGEQTEVYNGVNVMLNTRFRGSGQFSGGVNVGRTVIDNCAVVDSPQDARPGFCKQAPPWASSTQVKFLVVYPIIWDFQASAVYQNIPGIPITASVVVPNAQIAPSLGRDLGSCRGAAICNGTATVELIPPNSMFEKRLQQVDFRLARIFRRGKTRIEANLDLYNMLNVSDVLRSNLRHGTAWLNASEILPGRLIKFGMQVAF